MGSTFDICVAHKHKVQKAKRGMGSPLIYVLRDCHAFLNVSTAQSFCEREDCREREHSDAASIMSGMSEVKNPERMSVPVLERWLT